MDLIKSFPDHTNYNIEAEIVAINEFLKKSNLNVDPIFFTKVEKGDILEIYRFPENTQSFSNSEFRRLCSYSDEQMKTIPFPKLFWREDEVNLSVMRRSATVCNVENKLSQWGLGSHDLVESLHPKRRTFSINLKWISPCYPDGETKAVAFISTCCVEFIYELPE
ncbi:MAG: hypothetical protein WA160_12505 [Pseudobdellovibrio sp.]